MSFHLVMDEMSVGVAVLALGSIAWNIRKVAATSSAIDQVVDAPMMIPSDLRSVLSEMPKLVVVNGFVDVQGVGLHSVGSTSNGEYAILQSTSARTELLNQPLGLFGRVIASLYEKFWCIGREQVSKSITKLPFAVTDGLDSVFVDMEGTKHPLPLDSIFRDFKTFESDSEFLTWLYRLYGIEHKLTLFTNEEGLPIGKDIVVIGNCSLEDGNLIIKSCQSLPGYIYRSFFPKETITICLEAERRMAIFVGLFGVGVLLYLAWKWVPRIRDGVNGFDDDGGEGPGGGFHGPGGGGGDGDDPGDGNQRFEDGGPVGLGIIAAAAANVGDLAAQQPEEIMLDPTEIDDILGPLSLKPRNEHIIFWYELGLGSIMKKEGVSWIQSVLNPF